MLVVYKGKDGDVVSISGFREAATKGDIDSIHLVDPLPEGQAEYRIYDPTRINAVWEAHDAGQALKVILDDSGNPVSMEADGEVLFIS